MDPFPAPALERNWVDLGDGPAGLIADRVLARDVADYVRFRAVCSSWRRCSADPRVQGGLDRRFHPWQWAMLCEELAVPARRSFLNTSTGEFVQVDIPELHDHKVLASTPEGLLVLVHNRQRAAVHLLNPLTRQITHLPPLTTLLPPKHVDKLSEDYIYFDGEFRAWGSGIANDDSTTVLLCFNRLRIIGMAKPGDESWSLLDYSANGMTTAPLLFAGRFYCVSLTDVMVLEMGPNQPPQLKVAANLGRHVSPIAHSVHLMNNCGELMLVHRRFGRLTPRNKSGWAYNAYRVDFDSGTLFPVKSLGGRAVFMALDCSLSVPLDVFPSGSLCADTIYLRFDVRERMMLKAGAYHLADGSAELPCSLVPRPHTLIDCLSFADTVKK
ncbi:uncharacterized protein [Lolium perenne]|uniref:uncharacterized protein n=1 Tax=Lolium perenne TaxID=4522 RepID=UPI003A98DBDF